MEEAAPGGFEFPADRLALVLAELAELQQPVDEQPQTLVGRQPPGRGVRGKQQAGLGEIGHHIADRRGR
jgi:hypothetical protein